MIKTAVIAIGGNSLITDKEHQRVPDQYQACSETCRHIAGGRLVFPVRRRALASSFAAGGRGGSL